MQSQNDSIAKNKLTNLEKIVSQKIIGQKDLISSLFVALIAGGHVLIEGMPGLAKTTAAKAIAEGIEGDFHRVQFTPDLLPSDLIGTEIYLQEKSDFIFRRGPLFNNILLADEINRAPAKVQSALLEAMEEKQITVGHKTYKLPELYMVIATQNPIEQEGTYNLPEAQLDRFLMQINVGYPNHEEEMKIINLIENSSGYDNKENILNSDLTTQQEILSSRKAAASLYIHDKLKDYIVSIVSATRFPEKYDENLAKMITCGASPRATIGIIKCAKAYAWLTGSEYVTPYHVQIVAPSVLRHRIMPSFEAESLGFSRDEIVKSILKLVAVP